MKLITCLVAVFALILLACGPGEEPEVAVDDIATASEYAELLFENDSVQVVRISLPSQARLPLHYGGNRVVYSLNGYKLRYETPGYEPTIRDFRAGEAHWHSSGEHAVTSVAATTARYLTVTRKAPNPTPGVTSNLAEVDPENAKIVFENQNAKVLEVTLPPGATQPEHTSAGRIIYSLTPAKVRMTADGETSEAEYAEGDVHWHDGGTHSVTSMSEEPIRYLVFELM